MTEPLKKIDIKEFAQRVERLCDFLIAKRVMETGKDGSNDLRVVEDLKEDAADIQFEKVDLGVNVIDGLYDYMKGASLP